MGKAAAEARWSDPAQRSAASTKMRELWQQKGYREAQLANRRSPAARERQRQRKIKDWSQVESRTQRQATTYMATLARRRRRVRERWVVELSGWMYDVLVAGQTADAWLPAWPTPWIKKLAPEMFPEQIRDQIVELRTQGRPNGILIDVGINNPAKGRQERKAAWEAAGYAVVSSSARRS